VGLIAGWDAMRARVAGVSVEMDRITQMTNVPAEVVVMVIEINVIVVV